MSKGLPVIGCVDCAGTNEMIENKINGLLVVPNPNAFAVALVDLAKIDPCELSWEWELKIYSKMFARGYLVCLE